LLVFEKYYLKNKLYLADEFQYYFDEDFFKKMTVKDFNLFDNAYQKSIFNFSENYMGVLKKEAEANGKNFIKDDSFVYPFKPFNYYFGDELPYMPDYLF
jgi:hypothetical protein